MEQRELMIDIQDVNKVYRLGQFNATTLQHEIQSWWARRRGKDDPNRSLDATPVSNEEIYALNEVSFKAYKGETVGIIGNNGAGKSTLLKLICRVTSPTSGVIELYGRVTSMLEIGTGFNGELTGRENVYINGAILGMSKAEVDRKMDDIIDFSGLEEFIDTPVKRYSSGMYTKLGFAVAANLDSEIIIMDEVLAVGDISFQNKCLNAMRRAADDDGRTVLYVSHNMAQIRQLCDRCIVLEKGRVVFSGDTEKAVEFYMNRSSERKTSADYRGKERPHWLQDERMRLISAGFVGRDNDLISDGKRMDLRLKWHCFGEIDNIGLRIEVQSLTGQRLGTYVLDDMCSGSAGETVTADLSVNTECFRENSYNVIYCFYTRDEAGNYINLDRVEGLGFSRLNDRDSKLKWDFREWGYLGLEDAVVTGIMKETDGL